MRRIVALALVIVTAAVVITAAVAVAAESPKAVRAKILAAALAQESVHYTERIDRPHFGTVMATGDVNAHSGAEQQTLSDGSKIHMLRVRRTLYVKANAAALRYDTLYLSKAQATEYAGRWISIADGKKSRNADSLTLSWIVGEAQPQGNLKVLRVGSQGKRLLVVRGTGRFEVWKLAARPKGKPLPVTFSYFSIGSGFSGRFSKWDEPVHVKAPAHSTPIAVVRRS